MVLSAWVFSRWMGLIYLSAFWSLALQITGLVGHHGILPATDFLQYVKSQEPGLLRFWAAPTLCWFNSSDGCLLFLCWGGVVLALLLAAGIMPGLMALLLWVFYLSVTVAGQDFLGFQWDNLLLEAGFLLIFLMPRPLGVHFKPRVRPSMAVVWLLRWLLFRLMFESGMVKLLSGDTHWAHLTALTYHYWTQPLPNTISWYMAQLPLWFQKLSCAFLFMIELVFPFFIFCGRWMRLAAFGGITALQLLIIFTGNYCFFNLLAIGLSMTLLEDEHFMNLSFPRVSMSASSGGKFYKIVSYVLVSFILMVSVPMTVNTLFNWSLPGPLASIITAVSPLRTINNYGLFAIMTTQRNEIILEGSNDGEHWKPYGFRFKPGDVNKAPRWVMPYQPRLDWQMWFAALSSWRENQWFMVFMERILQGEPSVLRLLATNPFGDHPPKYLQATFWNYHFTDFKTRRMTGAWWQRRIKGLYCPTVTLQ